MFGKSATKRFEFKRGDEGGIDTRSYAVRKDVQEAVRETMEHYPTVAGFSMFGSRTKGLERNDSDVDIIMYFDFDAEHLENRNDKNQVPPIDFFETTLKRLLTDSFSEREAKEIMGNGYCIGEVLSRSIVVNEIEKSIQYLQGSLKGRERRDARSVYRANFTPPRGTIAGLFQMDVGGGLKPWRKLVIETLENSGLAGEKLWREMMRALKHSHEDHRTIFGWAKRPLASSVFPATLAEARQTYCRDGINGATVA